MGCTSSKAPPRNAPTAVSSTSAKSISINRDRSKRENYIVRNLKGDSESANRFCVVKREGEIAFEQFVIEECTLGDVFLLDNIEAVTVDLCNDMMLVSGPIEGSIFIRDCENCDFYVICQQFRMRNCKSCRVFLLSASSPIIETSSNIEFACHHVFYKHLPGQIKRSTINPWNNKWYDVFDFSANKSSFGALKNYTLKHHRDAPVSPPPIPLSQASEASNEEDIHLAIDDSNPFNVHIVDVFHSSTPDIASLLNNRISTWCSSLPDNGASFLILPPKPNDAADYAGELKDATHPFVTGSQVLDTNSALNAVKSWKFETQALGPPATISQQSTSSQFKMLATFYCMKIHEPVLKEVIINTMFQSFSLSPDRAQYSDRSTGTLPNNILLRSTSLQLQRDSILSLLDTEQRSTLDNICLKDKSLSIYSPKSMAAHTKVEWIIIETLITPSPHEIKELLLEHTSRYADHVSKLKSKDSPVNTIDSWALDKTLVRKHIAGAVKQEIFTSFGADAVSMSTLVFESMQPKV